jgi:SOS-response transcriptional repressor LexA
MQDCPHCGMMLTPRLGLTPLMKEVLDFIKSHIERFGFSPSYSEIGAGTTLKSRGRAYHLVRQLEARGHIMTTSASRSITVI